MIVGKAENFGFTLIELMVTISVMMILATVAAPNFQSMVVKNRLVADHNEVLTGFNYARSEAVKRREGITAILTPDGDGAGWTLEVSPVDVSADVLQVRDKSNSSVNISTSSDGMVTFNSLGRLSGTSSFKFEISYGGDNVRCIGVGLSGMVSSEEGGCG